MEWGEISDQCEYMLSITKKNTGSKSIYQEICQNENPYKLIRKEDAHLLAMYVQYFHTEEKGMKLLQCFNTTPENFKYEDVIKAVETIGQ